MKFGYFYIGEKESERMRRINVNLWDDYCQKPSYPFNNPTTLRVEDTKGMLSADEMAKLRALLYERCVKWKKRTNMKSVSFSKNQLKHDTIDIEELSEPVRKDLYSYLKKDDSAFGDIKIQWLMES